jgi:hypothetical protein
MVCDDASNNMHFFGKFSPYFQCPEYYTNLEVKEKTPITKYTPTPGVCYDDASNNELNINALREEARVSENIRREKLRASSLTR